MENNKFFKLIWRANAVFLFIAGIGLICLLVMFAALLIAESRSWNNSPPVVSSAANKNTAEEVFELRHPSQYEKSFETDYTYFELRSGKDSYGSLSSKSSQLRNIGVFDLNTNETHWVFPNQQQEIESFKSVSKTTETGPDEKRTIRTGFVLTLAKSLENGSVTRDIWVMSPNGKDARKLLSDVSTSPDIKIYGDNQKKIIIETETHIDVYPFDSDTLTVGTPTRVSMP